MNATQLVAELSAIAKAGQTLVEKLKPAAEARGSTPTAQRSALNALIKRAEKAEAAGKKLATDRVEAQIKVLGTQIDSLSSALTITSLSSSTKNTLRARRRSLRAKRGRLNAKLATDFSGVLNATEAKQLAKLLRNARAAVARRKKAAQTLEAAMGIADLAITIAGKVLAVA